jgi:hypothetical protein
MVSSWLPPAFVHRSFRAGGSLVDGRDVNRHLKKRRMPVPPATPQKDDAVLAREGAN